MKALIQIRQHAYEIFLDDVIDLSIGFKPQESGPSCFHTPNVQVGPVVAGDFIGSVAEGSAVNFYWTKLIPHGQGTHTECIGHILPDMKTMSDIDLPPYLLARVITVEPRVKGDDVMIEEEDISLKIREEELALIIRTLPNDEHKKEKDYSDTNPPYLSLRAAERIVDMGYEHLLLDLPSVDREYDGGKLLAHRTFWSAGEEQNSNRTITELIYVPDAVEDGVYLLQIQLGFRHLDAVPSRPLLYPIMDITQVVSSDI